MSAKSAKKPAKKLSVPRTMSDIQAEYQQLAAQAGQKQYQIVIGQEELSALNEKLRSVNREAAARQQLDRETEERANAAAPTTPEAPAQESAV